MVILIIIIHVFVSLGLIVAILLHSGKGAGMSSLFGGGLPSSFSGTSMIEKNLDRITIGLAVTFAVTTFILMLAMPKALPSSSAPTQQTAPTTPSSPGGTTPGGTTPGAPTAPTPGGGSSPTAPKPK